MCGRLETILHLIILLIAKRVRGDGLPAKISAPTGVDHRVHATVDPPEPGHHGR